VEPAPPRRSAYIGIPAIGKVLLAEPPICAHCGSLMQLRARHVQHARVVPDSHAEDRRRPELPEVPREGAQLTGLDAVRCCAGLTYLNVDAQRPPAKPGRRPRRGSGGRPDRLLHDVARRELTLRSLRRARLALEMAVDERAEVEELDRQWREAGGNREIAERNPEHVGKQLEEEMRRLKGRSAINRPVEFRLPDPQAATIFEAQWPSPSSRSLPTPSVSRPGSKSNGAGGATYVALEAHDARPQAAHGL